MATTEKTFYREVEYSDIDLRFSTHPYTGDITVIREYESIKEAIQNIVMTEPGEKPFNPHFGTPLRSLLFNNFSLNPHDLESLIRLAIEKFEKRVKVQEIIVQDYHDRNAALIEVIYIPLMLKQSVSLKITITRTK